MQFSEDKISEIIEKNDIVDVISGYLSVKKSGNNYTCLCPFHSENTPSFSISATKQMFYCFGCGVGGNVISFVQKIERMNFVESLKLLAEKAHVDLPQDNSKDLERVKFLKTLYNINVETARYYHKNLLENKKSLEYLKARGLSEKIITKFGLGYSLNEWEALYRHLMKTGYSINELKQSGLVLPKKDGRGFYDRFRGRIMFPIIDLKGNVIAFGGRVMDDSKPKYLNSPDTLTFNKGFNIFGMNFTKLVKNLKSILIVEGYMDVIALHQYGVQNAVASLGTAFTENQAKLLKRYSNEIIIAYDSDMAGQTATMRGLNILEKQGCIVKILRLPSGKDPDEYIRKEGVERFLNVIEKSLPLIEYKIENVKKDINIESLQDRIKFAQAFAEVLSDIESDIEVNAYVKKYALQMRINEESIYSELNRLRGKNIHGNNRHNINNIVEKDYYLKTGEVIAERNLLNICMHDMNNAKYIFNIINDSEFSIEIHRKIGNLINLRVKEGKNILAGEILSYFFDENEKSSAAQILNDEAVYSIDKAEIDSLIFRMKQPKMEREIDSLSALADELRKNGKEEESYKVLGEITQLQKKKNSFLEGRG